MNFRSDTHIVKFYTSKKFTELVANGILYIINNNVKYKSKLRVGTNIYSGKTKDLEDSVLCRLINPSLPNLNNVNDLQKLKSEFIRLKEKINSSDTYSHIVIKTNEQVAHYIEYNSECMNILNSDNYALLMKMFIQLNSLSNIKTMLGTKDDIAKYILISNTDYIPPFNYDYSLYYKKDE